MRVLHITASDVWRGHEQQIVYYINEFSKKDNPQVLLCVPDTKLFEIAKTNKNCSVYSLPFKSVYSIKWLKLIYAIIKKENIDIILIHNSKAQTMCVLSSLLFGWKTPMVYFRTLIKKVDTSYFRKWKYNYKGIKKIVCVSQAVIDKLQSAIDDKNRLSIVGSATDLEEFHKKEKTGILHRELNLPQDTLLIGNIAAFVPFKDHKTFVNAAELIVKEITNVRFILIGIGELENEIKAMVTKKNLDPYFIFLGFRNDVPNIFPEFDVFLFPSKLEPTGGVLLEAYASHVPVVACRAGGVPEVIVENETGLLCEPENFNEFSMKTLQLLKDKTLRDKIVTNGYQHLLQNFTKEIIANAMLHELEEVLNN